MSDKFDVKSNGSRPVQTHLGSTANEIETALHSQYRHYQYLFVEFVTSHLADCSRAFKGDLQQMLILGLIGQVALTDSKRASSATDGEQSDLQTGTLTASRIADITGLPRESVRRKLALLEAKGWIVRNPAAQWKLVRLATTIPAREDLAELDRRGIRRWAELLAALNFRIS